MEDLFYAALSLQSQAGSTALKIMHFHPLSCDKFTVNLFLASNYQ